MGGNGGNGDAAPWSWPLTVTGTRSATRPRSAPIRRVRRRRSTAPEPKQHYERWPARPSTTSAGAPPAGVSPIGLAGVWGTLRAEVGCDQEEAVGEDEEKRDRALLVP